MTQQAGDLPQLYGYDALLLIDASVDPKSKIGVAGFSIIVSSKNNDLAIQQPLIKTQVFEQTSSTDLELRAALWALSDVVDYRGGLAVVSDCQTLCQLPERRERLQARQFCNRRGVPLKLAELYRKILASADFRLETTGMTLNFIHIKGHRKSSQRSALEVEFSHLDQTVRRHLRSYLKLNRQDGS
ncbi:hypothetical protein PULV_a2819 [Pseudoalteromonas ulvae UL12]|uniref:RNase H type-1 domain-containing protein n=1 Tax=Pseudoalteromonas ulvae TaxID=107327 RepID=A0A244CNQ9_PSEDV|nr:hypothetical protein [Pseudoalteromonas ulvae]MBE0364476.1 hypothetical protein [Pseudoalteromonas ulvae UL12]OUL57234.1 hypothetical protein B1199_13775 [Pseudoalteromonas ulvae]